MEKVKGFTVPIIAALLEAGYIQPKAMELRTYGDRTELPNHISYNNVPAAFFLEVIVPMIPEEDYDDTQNYSPSIGEIINDCKNGTVLGVSGYIITELRADERLSIDTVFIPETVDDAISGNARAADDVGYAEIDGVNCLYCWYD